MKSVFKMLLLVSGLLVNTQFSQAQSICLVSADYQTGENYIVFWEQFASLINLDSVIIYRKQGTETTYTKIGAVDISDNSPTFFVDENANTIDFSRYAIAILDSTGTETAPSPWHQPMVMDWDPTVSGKFFWTKYKKEDQIDESYIFGYEYFIDETGVGAYQSFGYVMNYDTMLFDTQYSSHPNANYYVEASLPNCNIQTKANINTSRSNIKQQFTNAEAGVSTIAASSINFDIAPNPASEFLMLDFPHESTVKMTITDINGRIVKRAIINSNFYTIAIDDLVSGNYFVNIEQNGVISSKKFIKK